MGEWSGCDCSFHTYNDIAASFLAWMVEGAVGG